METNRPMQWSQRLENRVKNKRMKEPGKDEKDE